MTARYTAVMVVLAWCTAAAGCADIDDRPASWSYIHASIIAPNCTTASCHTSIIETAGLGLDDREHAYQLMTGKDCNTGMGDDHNFVYPGEPDRSKLMYLLRGDEVRRMPPDVPLPESEIAIIERWIVEGAPCN